ncbi:hypothetical protein [Bifidobacterium tsurumiense]|uniref:hypothetical protein n=1 Tax=Bifidobacterium tsurumiense TaxID=356829 RepID=UPI0018A6BEF9|nr:hypothetical protein [Bifidobacterium tsurumiense]
MSIRCRISSETNDEETRGPGKSNAHTKPLLPRVVFTTIFLAVTGLLLGSGVAPSPMTSAFADDATQEAGFCTPSQQTLGTDINVSNADPGVATWVKGDMYIGSRPSNTANLNGANAPVGSYAVEAEGLTLVNGKLAMNPLKESWGGNGFRFGIVGFGAQFRPTPGSTALAVNGDESASAIDSMTTGGVTGDVGAWTHGAFTEGYGAKLSGNATNWETNAKHKSVVYTKTDWDSSNSISWNQTNVLDNVNGKDYSDFGTYVNNLSTTLSLQQANGTVTYDTAPADSNYVRYKYNANSSNISYGFKFDASGKRSEKRITFTGDGTSALQVFKLKTSELQYIQSDDGTYQTNKNNPDDVNRGIVFDFENIPDNASVVVNVGGINDDGSGGSNVSFNNGWRFWWNGVEIGGGYSDKASTEQQRLYGVAS